MLDIHLSQKNIANINFVVLLLETIWYYYEGFPINKLLAILSFYTNFTQLSVVVYQVWSILEALLWKQQSLKLKRFQTFLVYQSLIVTICFWTIYLIQPNAIISKKHPISPYVLMTFHGGSFLYLYFLAIYTSGFQYSGNKNITIISGCIYIFFVVLNYLINDRLPYPFFKQIHPILAILIISLFVFILSSLYVLICKRFNKKINIQEDKQKQN